MSTSTLFDNLRREKGIASDAALARELEVSQARKKDAISDGMILRVHEYLGMPVAEIRQLLAQSASH